jgi:adenylate cyclase
MQEEVKPMENESISIDSRIFGSLIELKQPSETISDLIGRLLEQNEKQSVLVEQHQRLQRLIKLYIPEKVISDYMNNPKSLMVMQDRPMAVLFSDIHSFSKISEKMTPEEVNRNLNRYLQLMADIIYARDGIVDKYIGDAILAYFGYPVFNEKTVMHAVLAAIEMLDAIKKIDRKSSLADFSYFEIGIGINFGVVMIGNIGHPDKKLDFTVIGDNVNLGFRMETLTSTYQQEILLTESVHNKIKDVLPYRLVDTISVRGKEKPVRIFTTKKDLRHKEQTAWNTHNKGMDHFLANDFEVAVKCFRDVLEYQESDHLAKMMIERCTKNMQK